MMSGWSRRDEEKSGASHSISLSMPLRVRKLANKRYAVKGTPAASNTHGRECVFTFAFNSAIRLCNEIVPPLGC
jgi:hypothetical protein